MEGDENDGIDWLTLSDRKFDLAGVVVMGRQASGSRGGVGGLGLAFGKTRGVAPKPRRRPPPKTPRPLLRAVAD
jgi:hypothetical protein